VIAAGDPSWLTSLPLVFATRLRTGMKAGDAGVDEISIDQSVLFAATSADQCWRILLSEIRQSCVWG